MDDTYNEMLGILLGRTAAAKKRNRSVYIDEIRKVLHGYNPFWASHVLMRMYEDNVISLELPAMNFSGNDYDTSKYVISSEDGEHIGWLVMNSSGTPVYGAGGISSMTSKLSMDLSNIDSQWFIVLRTDGKEFMVRVTPYTGADTAFSYYSAEWPEELGINGDIKLATDHPDSAYIYINTKYPESEVVLTAEASNNVIEGLIDAKLLEEFSLTGNASGKVGILGLALYRLWKTETLRK